MEKNTDKKDSNKYKKLLAISLFVIVEGVILALGLCIHLMHNEVLMVKYVNDENNIVVQTYYKGEKISFPETPIKIGYSFVGWSLDNDQDNILTQEILVEDELTLYAQWKEKVYMLSYGDQDIYLTHHHEFVEQHNKLIIIGDNTSIEISQPSQKGKKFLRWEIVCGQERYNLKEFSFDKISAQYVQLIPVYEDIVFQFDLPSSPDYIISNVSHNGYISQCDTLTFHLSLKDYVNMSIPQVLSTSGEVVLTQTNDGFYVIVSNFVSDFNISIEDVKINIYDVVFTYDNDQLIVEVPHGEILTGNQFDREGYTLIGFKDASNTIYNVGDIVTSNMILEVIWEKDVYTITLPKNNGMFALNLAVNPLSSNRIVYREYNQSVEFCVILSKAYDQSDYVVYGINGDTKIYPTRLGDDIYVFENIQCDMEVVVDNISLNYYDIIIDGKYQDSVAYGSWVYIEDDMIFVRDIETNMIIEVESLLSGADFAGWMCNDMALTTGLVQDIANKDGIVDIYGRYNKKVARVTLVANGGEVGETEKILVEGEEFDLPEPIKAGYTFVGWFTTLVEVNTEIELEASTRFNEITDAVMVLYAGWSK